MNGEWFDDELVVCPSKLDGLDGGRKTEDECRCRLPSSVFRLLECIRIAAYDNPTSPVDLLASYYNAIDRQEYQRAYGYWQTPPSDYDTFVRGYAGTASVLVIVRPPTRIDVGAGNAYAQIPTVLLANRTDGSTQTFAGCYTAHKINIQPSDTWHISGATIAPVASDAAIPALLAQACTSY